MTIHRAECTFGITNRSQMIVAMEDDIGLGYQTKELSLFSILMDKVIVLLVFRCGSCYIPEEKRQFPSSLTTNDAACLM